MKEIHEYQQPTVSETVRKCSEIITYVYQDVIITWKLLLLDETVIYISSKKSEYKTCHIKLSDLNFQQGTQFRLLADPDAKRTSYASDIIQYEPNSGVVYYYYRQYDSGAVNYTGEILSPYSPPILNCSSLSVYNDGSVVTKWTLISLTTNQSIYTSGKYRVGSTWSIALKDLQIPAGTQLRLHASVTGSDSEPYVILQYDPTTSKTGVFTLGGNAFITVTMLGSPRK